MSIKCRYFIHMRKTSHLLPENFSSDIALTSLRQKQSISRD